MRLGGSDKHEMFLAMALISSHIATLWLCTRIKAMNTANETVQWVPYCRVKRKKTRLTGATGRVDASFLLHERKYVRQVNAPYCWKRSHVNMSNPSTEALSSCVIAYQITMCDGDGQFLVPVVVY